MLYLNDFCKHFELLNVYKDTASLEKIVVVSKKLNSCFYQFC